MKNMKLVALAALGLALPALAELQSANIVGYQTMPLESGNFTTITIPFQHVNNDGNGLMLNQDITVSGVYGDPIGTSSLSDQIWIWDPEYLGVGGYVKFYYDVGMDGEDGWSAGWMNTKGKYFEQVYPKGLSIGGAIYYKATEGEKSITGAGAVESDPEVEIALASNNFTMFGNPYPVATKLNSGNMVVKGLYGDPDGTSSASDQVWIWDPQYLDVGGYVKFYYDVGMDGEDGWSAGWMNTKGKYFEQVYPNGLPSGTPIYYKAMSGAKSVVFTSPIK